jgi:hypothetical protein
MYVRMYVCTYVSMYVCITEAFTMKNIFVIVCLWKTNWLTGLTDQATIINHVTILPHTTTNHFSIQIISCRTVILQMAVWVLSLLQVLVPHLQQLQQ